MRTRPPLTSKTDTTTGKVTRYHWNADHELVSVDLSDGSTVTYSYDPYSVPIRGRAAIVYSWLEQPDSPGTYDGHYEPLLIEGDYAVANGRSRYFEQDGSTLKAEWDNLFVLRFDSEGRCMEYREWYMPRPQG